MTRVYAFDNHHPAASAHHAALAEALDPFTQDRITRLVDWHQVDRCLEVGAGGGSIAWWLAEQVGPTGEAVAVDLKPNHIPPHPQLEAVGHDLTSADPWPATLDGPFDLIHARLTLSHLPNRHAVLHHLAVRLAPGGVLVVEDQAGLRDDVVVSAPNPEAGQLYQTFQHAMVEVLERAGTDRTWARRIHTTMRAEGLVGVTTEIHGRYWTGGSAGLRLTAAGLAQIRSEVLATDLLTEQQLTELAELVHDPELIIHGHPLYSSAGQRER